MSHHAKTYSLTIIILVSIFLRGSTFGYASSPSTTYLISQNDTQLTLLSVDNNLEVNLAWQFPPLFEPLTLSSDTDDLSSHWFIPNVESIAVSPDGEKVAIVARQDGQENVFVYELDGELLGFFEDITLMGMPGLCWSPDSQKLVVNSRFFALFETNTGEFRHLINDKAVTRSVFGQFSWVDNNRIVFTSSVYDESVGSSHDNLNLLNTETNNLTILSRSPDLPEWDFWQTQESENGRDGWDSICGITWSEQFQRVYYVVGCPFSVDDSSLYSVNLDGNNRLELSLHDLYPTAISNRIHTLHVGIEGIYAFAHTVIPDDETNQEATNNWRLFKITASSSAEVIFETSASTGNLKAAISPSGDKIAFVKPISFGESQQIHVIDVKTNAVITSPFLDTHPCDFQWLNEHIVIYSASNVMCTPAVTRREMQTFDIRMNTVSNLNIEEETSVWLVNTQSELESLIQGETFWNSN